MRVGPTEEPIDALLIIIGASVFRTHAGEIVGLIVGTELGGLLFVVFDEEDDDDDDAAGRTVLSSSTDCCTVDTPLASKSQREMGIPSQISAGQQIRSAPRRSSGLNWS